MANFLLIFICLGVGMLLRKHPTLPNQLHQGLNVYAIYVALPSLSLFYIPTLRIGVEVLFPFLVGVLVLLLSVLFFQIVHYFYAFSRATLGCLVLVCGLGNISFVGFPIVEGFYGKEGLAIAIFVDQGSFITLAILGVSLALMYQGETIAPQVIFRKILSFPPFIAFVLAIILNISGTALPEVLQQTFRNLGNTLTPVALTSVGYQLSFRRQSFRWVAVQWGLLYKLMIAPLFILGLYGWFFQVELLTLKVSVIEAAMPPMVTAAIVASEHRLNPELANFLVGMGLLLSLPLVYGWYCWLAI